MRAWRGSGSRAQAETIHVHRPRFGYVEATKVRERCTNAAFVTATIAAGEAVRLTGGRLRPGAEHEDFAELLFRGGRIEARLTSPSGGLRQSVWLDARDGFVVGAELARPNHAEFKDFKLRLTAEAKRRGSGC